MDMPDTGSNPFAEPDFSALQTSSSEANAEDDYNDDDGEELEDGFEDDELDEADLDEQDEDEEPDAPDQVSAKDLPAVSELEEDDAGNRVAGGTARSVLEHVARSIVDDPEGVAVEVSETRNGVHLALHVAQGDMGRII